MILKISNFFNVCNLSNNIITLKFYYFNIKTNSSNCYFIVSNVYQYISVLCLDYNDNYILPKKV